MEDKPNDHSFAKYLVAEKRYTARVAGQACTSTNAPTTPPPGNDCPTCRWFANGGGSDTEPGGYLSATFNDFTGNIPANNALVAWCASGQQPQAPPVWWLHHQHHCQQIHRVAPQGGRSWRTPWQRRWFGDALRADSCTQGPALRSHTCPWYETGTWVDNETAPCTGSYGVDASRLKGHHGMIAGQGSLTLGRTQRD